MSKCLPACLLLLAAACLLLAAGCWLPAAACGCLRLLAAAGGWWRLLAAAGGCWLLLLAAGWLPAACCWLLAGGSWLQTGKKPVLFTNHIEDNVKIFRFVDAHSKKHSNFTDQIEDID